MKNTIWTGLGLGLSLWVIVGCKPVRPTHDFLADNIRFAAKIQGANGGTGEE